MNSTLMIPAHCDPMLPTGRRVSVARESDWKRSISFSDALARESMNLSSALQDLHGLLPNQTLLGGKSYCSAVAEACKSLHTVRNLCAKMTSNPKRARRRRDAVLPTGRLISEATQADWLQSIAMAERLGEEAINYRIALEDLQRVPPDGHQPDGTPYLMVLAEVGVATLRVKEQCSRAGWLIFG